jgi:YD repeat-containing protein
LSGRRDHAGRIVRLTDPTGRHAQVDHADGGRTITGVDASGRRDSWHLDLLDQLSALVRADGSTDTFTYDANGMLVGRTDLTGSRLVLERTPAGRVADGQRRHHPLATTPPARCARLLPGRRLVAVERMSSAGSAGSPPRRPPRGWRYDLSGRVVETDVAGAVWTYRYDPCGNMVGTTDPTGRTTSYEYDLLGQMVACTDSAGATTRYMYTVRGRVASMVDPSGGLTCYGGHRSAFATTTTTARADDDVRVRRRRTAHRHAYADGSRTVDDSTPPGWSAGDGAATGRPSSSAGLIGRTIDLVETEVSPSGPGSVSGAASSNLPGPRRTDAPPSSATPTARRCAPRLTASSAAGRDERLDRRDRRDDPGTHEHHRLRP